MRKAESTIYRWETPKGAAALDWPTVKALCEVYGADDATTQSLVALAQETGQLLGWLDRYGEAPSSYLGTYLGLEATARRISMYHGGAVPGLFHTEDYARAIVAASLPHVEPDEVKRRVSIRLERQSILDREGPPLVWVVLDEAVLRRPIAGSAATKRQLEHLLACIERPNVTIQVLPLDGPAHPAIVGAPIVLLDFPEAADLPVVYLESAVDGLFIEEPTSIDQYSQILDHLRASALPVAESRSRIAAAAAAL